jgi:glucose-6-phosphate isomerase
LLAFFILNPVIHNGPSELGKVLAQRLIPELESEADPNINHDSSTNNVIRHYRKRKDTT